MDTRVVAAFVFLLCAASPAAATATLTCDIGDPIVNFSMQAAVGSYSSIGSLKGVLELKVRGDDPKASIELTSENLTQHWIEKRELRLRLYAPGDHSPDLELTLIARRSSEYDFAGRYRLSASEGGKTKRYSGRVKCALG